MEKEVEEEEEVSGVQRVMDARGERGSRMPTSDAHKSQIFFYPNSSPKISDDLFLNLYIFVLVISHNFYLHF